MKRRASITIALKLRDNLPGGLPGQFTAAVVEAASSVPPNSPANRTITMKTATANAATPHTEPEVLSRNVISSMGIRNPDCVLPDVPRT